LWRKLEISWDLFFSRRQFETKSTNCLNKCERRHWIRSESQVFAWPLSIGTFSRLCGTWEVYSYGDDDEAPLNPITFSVFVCLSFQLLVPFIGLNFSESSGTTSADNVCVCCISMQVCVCIYACVFKYAHNAPFSYSCFVVMTVSPFLKLFHT